MPPWEKYGGTESGPWEKYGNGTATLDEPKPVPSMGQVALNAVPRGIATLLNTPVALKDLTEKAVALLPFAGHFPALQAAADRVTPNYPEMALTKLGVIDPASAPQTAPQRIVDKAIQTGISMAAAPASSVGQVLSNAAVGAVSGMAGQGVTEATGNEALGTVAGMLTPLALYGLQKFTPPLPTSVGKETLKRAQAEGYVVQPSTVKPTGTANKLESVAGKAAVEQDAALRNQAVTNRLAARSLELPPDTPLTMAILKQVRDKAAKPYEEVEKLRATPNMPWFPRYHSTNLVEELKQARADATAFYKAYDRTPDPSIWKQAEASTALANSIEKDLENIARAAGKPELIDKLKDARKLYAKSHDVERALNLGDGNVSAPVLGRMLDKGHPLSGDLETIAKFAQAYPRVMREAAFVPPPSVSGTDAASAAILATTGYGAAGGPMGLLPAGLPLLRAPARNLVLSQAYQSRLLKSPPSFDRAAVRSLLAGRVLQEPSSN